MKKLVLFFVVMLFIVPISIAKTDYNESGNFDNEYQLGFTFFNQELDPVTDISVISRGLTNQQRLVPLVTDLDNNGVNEIIILDGDDLRLFQNSTLGEIDSLDIGVTQRTSNMITFDIDGLNNSFTEIILIQEEENFDGVLQILQWNGTNLFNLTSIRLPSITHFNGEMAIKCRAVNDCLMVYADHISRTDEGGAAGDMFVSFFNSTDVVNELNIDSAPSGSSTYCMPKIRHIVATDFDEDGDLDYIFSVGEVLSSGLDQLNIYYVDVTSKIPSLLRGSPLEIDVSGVDDPIGDSCAESTGNYGRFYTSPLVFDLKVGGGEETVIGFNVDDNEFNMRSYDSSGTTESTARIDSYPLLQDADGQIISNPFRANIFDDSGNVDFCVMGSLPTSNQIDLLCASEQATFGLFDNIEFLFDKEDRFNISEDFNDWNILTHSITAKSTDVPNNDEILNSYGVFDANFGSCNIFGFCDLDIIFENPKGDGVMIASDVENVGAEDLILLSSTSIHYLDDQLIDLGADIVNEDIIIDPCIDAPIKINSSMSITFPVIDLDTINKDLVNAKVIVYVGTANEQDTGFSSNFVSGATFTFTAPSDFKLNQTISNGIIRLVANDTGGSDNLDTVEFPFTIATNGVEFNDCRTIGIDVTQECTTDADCSTGEVCIQVAATGICQEIDIPPLNVSREARENAGLSGFFEEASNLFRVSPLIVALFLMLGFTIAVLTTLDRANDSMITMNKIMFIIFGNALIFIIASIMGAIPFGVLLVVIIFGIFGIVLWARRMFTATEM